jgi:transcriptional regulator with XRE-family HTH domain
VTTATSIKAAAGRVLRAKREAEALSQEQLGFLAGLHRTYISSAERGERNLSLEALERWLTALDMSWERFGAAMDGERAARRRVRRAGPPVRADG